MEPSTNESLFVGMDGVCNCLDVGVRGFCSDFIERLIVVVMISIVTTAVSIVVPVSVYVSVELSACWWFS